MMDVYSHLRVLVTNCYGFGQEGNKIKEKGPALIMASDNNNGRGTPIVSPCEYSG